MKKIAHELAESLRKNVSVDWTVRDSGGRNYACW